jgi:hypothetical protein
VQHVHNAASSPSRSLRTPLPAYESSRELSAWLPRNRSGESEVR